MKKETVFRNASQEVRLKARLIAGCRTSEEARREYDIGSGYLCALYDADIFDRATFTAGAGLLKAAYREAEKKTAPGAGNTRSSKENNSIQSIAVIISGVKGGIWV